MNNNEKTKKAFLFLMMLTVALASSGCGMLEINQKRASQIVVTREAMVRIEVDDA